MITGCYDMHLYCDFPGCKAQREIQDELGSACRRIARKVGWRLDRDGRCFCPTHKDFS